MKRSQCTALCVVVMLVALGCDDEAGSSATSEGSGAGAPCGTRDNPQYLRVTDIDPPAGAVVVNDGIMHRFTIESPPPMLEISVIYSGGPAHTAGSLSGPVEFTYTQTGSDVVVDMGPVFWENAPAEVRMGPELEPVPAADGCVYALPRQLYSYSIQPGAGGAGGAGGQGGAGGTGGQGGSPITNHLWSKNFAHLGAAGNPVRAIATDGSGNVVITGFFDGSVDFGGGALTSAGGADIYVAMFDSSGAHLWSERFGDSLADYGVAVATDGSGNVVITGSFSGSVDFGGGVLTSAGNGDMFVAKYDSSGTHLWSKRFGGSGDDGGNGVATDGSGKVVTTGSFSGSVDFGGGALTSAGNTDIFVAKYDGSGTHVWSNRFGGSAGDGGNGVATDGSGNVVITGGFDGSVDFGGGALTSVGGPNMFMAKYDSGGGHLWSNRFGAGGLLYSSGVTTDGAGSVLMTGWFDGTVNFGGGPMPSAGGYSDAFVAKFDGGGGHLWSKRFGDSGIDNGWGVATDSSGNAVVTGVFGGTVDFGGGPLTTVGNVEMFVAKYDGGGNHLWSNHMGASGDLASPVGVATDSSDNILITGTLFGTVDLGGGPLVSAGGYDIFLAKYAP